MKKIKQSYSCDSAFSLVEVVIAIGIASFCLVAMLGLIPSGMKAVRASTEQTAATSLMMAIASDLRTTPSSNTISSQFGITIPSSGGNTNTIYLNEDGSTNASAASSRYAVSVTLSNSANATALTSALIQIWWPAAAQLTNAQGSIETVTAFSQN